MNLGAVSFSRNTWKNRKFIIFHVRTQVENFYRNSIFGVAWVFFPGLAKVCIYAIVFGNIMSREIPNGDGRISFVVYLVPGILMWEAFSLGLNLGLKSFVSNRSYILAGYMPLGIIPVVQMLESAFNAMINMVVVILLLVFMGAFDPLDALSVFPIVVMQQIFATSLGVSLGILRVFFPDVEHITSIMTQVWFWGTPIVYPLTILPDFILPFVEKNPMTYFIECYHLALSGVDGYLSYKDYLATFLITATTVCLMVFLFRTLRYDMESAL